MDGEPDRLRVFTIGHSNHPLDFFLDLLSQHEVELVADIRSAPYSRYSPQFNQAPLREDLQARDIQYDFMGHRLGGRPADEACYDEDGRVVYDRMEALEPFQHGITTVQDLAIGRRVCLMCSEEDPATCHRALSVGHVLASQGVAVEHIRRDGSVQSQEELRGPTLSEPLQFTLFEETPPRKSLQPVSPERRQSSSSES